MRARRLVFAAVVALLLTATAVRVFADGYCFPGCGLYTPWDFEYYMFQCWQCPPNPPEG
mgnify:CR=1 FL=1